MRTVAAVIALVACVHVGLWALTRDNLDAPGYEGLLASVSYAPFQGNANPDAGSQAQAEQIRADLKLLAPLTRAIRTYSATGGVELVPDIAAEFGLRVTVGAWIDKDKARNEREIRSVIDLWHRHSNVIGIFVGNETIYRGEEMVPDLIAKISNGSNVRSTCPSRPAKSGTCGGSTRSSCRRSISSPRTSCPIGKASPTSRRSIRQS